MSIQTLYRNTVDFKLYLDAQSRLTARRRATAKFGHLDDASLSRLQSVAYRNISRIQAAMNEVLHVVSVCKGVESVNCVIDVNITPNELEQKYFELKSYSLTVTHKLTGAEKQLCVEASDVLLRNMTLVCRLVDQLNCIESYITVDKFEHQSDHEFYD